MQRVCEPKGSAQSGQNFRKRGGQNLRNPQQELMLDGQGSTRTALRDQTLLTITGTLNNQACDDRLCYDPVTLPLSWTVGLRPIVTQQTTRPSTK